MIDLTHIGHEENILYEITNKDALLKAKFPEAHIVDHLDPIPTELPSWLPAKEKRTFNLFSALRP